MTPLTVVCSHTVCYRVTAGIGALSIPSMLPFKGQTPIVYWIGQVCMLTNNSRCLWVAVYYSVCWVVMEILMIELIELFLSRNPFQIDQYMPLMVLEEDSRRKFLEGEISAGPLLPWITHINFESCLVPGTTWYQGFLLCCLLVLSSALGKASTPIHGICRLDLVIRVYNTHSEWEGIATETIHHS